MSHLGASPLGVQCDRLREFQAQTDHKSSLCLKFSQNSHSHTANAKSLDSKLHSLQPPNLTHDARILESSLPHSHTANAKSLDSKIEAKSEILESNENLKSSLRGEAEAIQNQISIQTDCHDSANAESRNDSNTDSSDLQNRNEINATLSQTAKSVVGGLGDKKGDKENDFAFVRSTNPHLQIQAPLSPFDKNNRNEVAARIKKSESEAERNEKDSSKNRNLESSEFLESSLRESGASEAVYKNTDSKDSKHLDSMDCHASANAESRNDKLADSNRLPRSLAASSNDKNTESKKFRTRFCR